MPSDVKNTADNSQVHSNAYVAADFDSPELIEGKKQLSLPGVNGEMSQWLFDGIRMTHSDLLYRDETLIEWKGSLDVVTLGFNMKGKVFIEQTGSRRSFTFANNQHNALYAGDSECVMRNCENRSEMFMVQFNKQAFLRLTENTSDNLMRFRDGILKGNTLTLSPGNEAINLEMQTIIRSILDCPYTGGTKKMFLLSKSFELLVIQSQLFANAEGKKYTYCKTDYDKERILFAREYLVDNFTAPPSLTQLAKITGINEFKLKKGFKEIFGTTVFTYLSNYKLEIAKAQLCQGKKTISEISYELGYSSPQHFSAAFKRGIGISPSDLKLTS